jgi:hypothetical protein
MTLEHFDVLSFRRMPLNYQTFWLKSEICSSPDPLQPIERIRILRLPSQAA